MPPRSPATDTDTDTDGTRCAGLLAFRRLPGSRRLGPPSSSSAWGRCGDLVRCRAPGGARNAGLLTRIRLNGGSGSASSDQGGHF